MSVVEPYLDIPLRGVQLIEASAGTGKTYTLATLVLRLVVEERLRVSQIQRRLGPLGLVSHGLR